MPSYTTKRKRTNRRDAQRIKRSVPRDRRQLLRWAATGTHEDYERLRRHASKVQHRAPSYIDGASVASIAQHGSRRHLAENTGSSTFLDGLAWLIDQVPGGKWSWARALTQGAMKPFRGDAVHEEDEVYALLLDQAYKDDPKDAMGQWTRRPELGSDYVQVFDNVDGHRFIAVRGTKLHGSWQELGTDLAHDAGLAVGLDPSNVVGAELQRILDHTRPGTVVDVGGHSLSTSLIAKAYDENSELQDRVRQTFMYNPVFSPVAPRNVTDKYEADERVRWFIDLLDTVSLGDLGSAGPKNVVYRSTFGWNPIGPHELTAWANDRDMNVGTQGVKRAEEPAEDAHGDAQHSEPLPASGMGDAFGAGGLLDFGSDNWDAADFGL